MSALALAALVILSPLQGEESPSSAVSPPVAWLRGDVFDVRVDLDAAHLTVVDGDGASIVEVPIGTAIRPSRPARRFASVPELVETLDEERSASPEGGAGATVERTIYAALFRLMREDGGAEPPISVGVRGGPYGPLVTYSYPRRAFRDLRHRTSFDGDGRAVTIGRGPGGRPIRVAGRTDVNGVTVDARATIRLLLDEGFSESPLRALRLRGAFGIDDASPDGVAASFVVRIDGVDVGGAPELARGDAAHEFDVPLRDGRELVLEFTPGKASWETATAALLDARFEGPGDEVLPVADVLRADRGALELLTDEHGGVVALGPRGPLVPLAPEPDPSRVGVPWIDAARTDGAGVAPGPLLLPFEASGGWLVGLGLVHLPDATRFGFDAGRAVVELPTTLLAGDPSAEVETEDEERVRMIVAIVVARSVPELYERYRSTLIATGGSATRRAVGSLTVPTWWRNPLLFCVPPAGHGRFGRFDVLEIEKRITDVESRLGLQDFTVVVDGPWMSRDGDPRPSEEFSRLKVLTAAQHVKGRHVLLRWPLFAAAPGSLADVIGAQADGRLVVSRPKKVKAFLHEVVRACLGGGLHSLGADGFVLTGTADLGDPARHASSSDLDEGVGLRELGVLLRSLRMEVDRRELGDALLAAPCALPQIVTDHGAIVFDPAPGDAATRERRLERLVSVLPDLPILVRPLDETPDEVIDWAARTVAIGVPSVGSRTLGRLDDAEAKTLGAILALAAARPLGIPKRIGDDWRMVYDERVLAETLPGRAGVCVFPQRGVALVALTRDGDATLPFQPVALENADGASIEFTADGVVLVGGRAGTIYRLRTE